METEILLSKAWKLFAHYWMLYIDILLLHKCYFGILLAVASIEIIQLHKNTLIKNT